MIDTGKSNTAPIDIDRVNTLIHSLLITKEKSINGQPVCT